MKDSGSLHGTAVNDKMLEQGAPHVLSHGDVLRFGTFVSRGLDVFLPVICKVEIQTVAARCVSSFRLGRSERCFLTNVPRPIERARSYCAPESVDGLSDSGGSDCSSVYGEDVSPKTPATDDKCDDLYAASQGDITLALDTQPQEKDASACGEEGNQAAENMDSKYTDSEHSQDLDADAAWDDLLEEGEVRENSVDFHIYPSAQVVEDNKDADSDDYDGGEFLDRELRQINNSDSGTAVTPDVTDSAQEYRLFTPVSGSPANAPISAEPDEADIDDEESRDSEMAEAAVSEQALDLNGLVKVSVTTKCNISSILNPPSAPLSPVEDEVDIDGPAVPGAYHDTQDLNTSGINAAISQQSTGLQFPRSDVPLEEPLAAAAIEEVPDTVMQRHDAIVDESKDLVDVAEDKKEDEDAAMMSAAVFCRFRKANESRKRKANDMLASDADPSTTLAAEDLLTPEATTTTETVSDAPAENGPAAKRQATTAAVDSRKKSSGRMWAAAEKVGIAALGGAVVLGSLIYTAPAF